MRKILPPPAFLLLLYFVVKLEAGIDRGEVSEQEADDFPVCHRSIVVGPREIRLKDCKGEFCFRSYNRRNNVSHVGCVTGVPSLQPGCSATVDEIICVCHNNESCNGPLNMQHESQGLSTTTSSTDTGTRHCLVFNSRRQRKPDGYETCEADGQICYYRKERYQTLPGVSILRETAGCQEFSVAQNPSHLLVSGEGRPLLMSPSTESICIQVQNEPDGGVTECLCRPSTKPTCGPLEKTEQKSAPLVNCRMAALVLNDSEHLEEQCRGEFCYVRRISVPDDDEMTEFQKGCLNVSQSGARLATVGYRQFQYAMQNEQIWLCDTDLCNADIGTARASIEDRTDNATQLLISQLSSPTPPTTLQTTTTTQTNNLIISTPPKKTTWEFEGPSTISVNFSTIDDNGASRGLTPSLFILGLGILLHILQFVSLFDDGIALYLQVVGVL